MTKEQPSITTTKKKIGKVTYIIESSASPTAKESIIQRIQKNIRRDIER